MSWLFKTTLFNIDENLNRLGTYMEKFYILPVYGLHPNAGIHRFHSSDDRSLGLHDHPYDFVAVTLFGRGREVLRGKDGKDYQRPLRRIRFYPARKLHAIKLDSASLWTLVITGPRWRLWGFDDGERWIPYHWALDRHTDDFWKKFRLARFRLFGFGKDVGDREFVERQMEREGKIPAQA